MESIPDQKKFLDNSIGLVTYNPTFNHERNIIYFPYAGGSSSTILPILEYLKDSFAISAIDSPGHVYTDGNPVDDIHELCTQYLTNLPKALFTNKVILFGHSLGAYIACHLASLLVETGIKPTLILSAAPPPHLRDTAKPLSTLHQDELISVLISLGGLPPSWTSSPELFSLFEPALRADFKMYENFYFNSNIKHLKTLIIGGYGDELCLPHQLFEWNMFFDDPSLDFVSGSHLFLKNSPLSVAEKIKKFV